MPSAIKIQSAQSSYADKSFHKVSHELKENESFVLKKQGLFSHEKRPIPALASDKHVLVEKIATGLCGSDVHYWQHGRIGQFVVNEPLILGHESAGIIVEVGSAVTAVKIGDRVALEPGIPCRTCHFCQIGKYNLCDTMQFAATPPVDGTLCAYYAIPEDFVYLLPEHTSIAEGALVEPLSIAVHATRLGGVATGQSVLVMGAGPIGLLCCAVSRSFGASSVACVDIVDSRLEFARTFAAHNVYKMTEISPEENSNSIKKHCGIAEGFDVVIDATGAAPCISCGIHALRRGATFIQAGLGKSEITIPMEQICSKEALFRGTFRYGPGDYRIAIELLRSKKLSVKELITNTFPFSEAEDAFSNVAGRKGIKTVIWGPHVGSDQGLNGLP